MPGTVRFGDESGTQKVGDFNFKSTVCNLDFVVRSGRAVCEFENKFAAGPLNYRYETETSRGTGFSNLATTTQLLS